MAYPNSLHVEVIRGIVVARVFGGLTEAIVRERHARILQLAREAGSNKVLVNALNSDAPSFKAELQQQALTRELEALGLTIAVVIRNHRMSYLAGEIFGEPNKIFYDDFEAALRWLAAQPCQ